MQDMVDELMKVMLKDRPYVYAVGDKVRYVGAVEELSGAVGTVASLHSPIVPWPYYVDFGEHFADKGLPPGYKNSYNGDATNGLFPLSERELERVQ